MADVLFIKRVPNGGDSTKTDALQEAETGDTLGTAHGGSGRTGITADTFLYASATDTFSEAPLTAAGRALLDDADAATQRATLGVAIGTDVQAYDATLQSLSSLGTVADRLAYTTALDTWAETAITSFGRSLIDDADAATARATLGFISPILDKASPGAIGGTTPSTGAFTTLSVSQGQIAFPATQNPSADVNTLDDYEEGTWTATVADAATGGNTSTTGAGTYTKIGNQVRILVRIADIDTTPLTGTNELYILGIPFMAADLSTFQFNLGHLGVSRATQGAGCVGIKSSITDNTDYIRLREDYNNGSVNFSYSLINQFTDDQADIYIDITYFTS